MYVYIIKGSGDMLSREITFYALRLRLLFIRSIPDMMSCCCRQATLMLWITAVVPEGTIREQT